MRYLNRLSLDTVAVLALVSVLAAPAGAECVGDCNGDDRVSIAELQACVNRGASLAGPACAAADRDLDGSVDPNEVDACVQSFLDAATCPMVYTPVPTPTITDTPAPIATNTTAPTNTVAPTNTTALPPTATFTEAPSATPTPTPTIAERDCSLASASSGIQLHIAALPVPLAYGLSGTIGIGAGPADASGNSGATCSVKSLDPINIPSIGFVCISAGAACPVGTRDCDGGTPLGVDVQSDGNTGTCTGNAACQTTCNAQCGGAAKVLSAQCTGYCTAGDQGACTSDEQCAPLRGACNGPDNLGAAQKDICQCTCLDNAAHGASEPGDLQCNLGSSLLVENGAPCGDGDVKIEVGSTCIPVTTQRATGRITDSNFTAGATVPGAGVVNDNQGTTVSCATLDAGTVSGIQGVGAANFFGSALGDLAVGLRAQCQ
jgi:hypothetical protein